jgi:hypothetical protein
MDKALLMPTEKSYDESAVDFSIFSYSLSLMNEANLEIINSMESIGIITEASGDKKYNFDGILQAIVDAICNVLKYILGKILSLLVKLGSYGKSFELEIRAFKEKLTTYHGYLRFEDYYEFTHIDDFENYPNDKIVNTLREDINNYIEKFKSLVNKNKTFAELQFNIANIKPDVDTDASVFRYELLGRKDSRYSEPMSDEIFNNECFKLFRNGQDNPYETADLTAKHLMERVYEPYVKGGSNQRRIKSENERIQKDIKKAVKSIDKTAIDVSRFSISEQQTILQSYAQVQQAICELFNRKCKDVVTMYSAKLQAYKDFQVQSRRILTQAMAKVVQL